MTDPYAEPDTGVLRNRYGITDRVRLRAVEADISAAAVFALGVETLPGSYNLEHLRSFHRRIFGLIYPWAGETRTVAIAKTDLFCLPHLIEPRSHDVFLHLGLEKHLRDLSRESFVGRVAHYVAEADLVHHRVGPVDGRAHDVLPT